MKNKLIQSVALMIFSLVLGLSTVVRAETPKSMLVMAKNIGDIITFDPAEAFELTTGELLANTYDRLMMYEPENLTELVGGVAQSWDISDDGKKIRFTIRQGLRFHSGNPVRAQDVEFSLRRAVKLNKTPAFIIAQFGWTEENVDEMVQATDDNTLEITIVEDFSPGLVLNALSAGIASVVDKKLVLENEVEGDMGYSWLKSRTAGSGPYRLKTWRANELVTLDRFEDYRHGSPEIKRIIVRHIPESSAQRLQLEKGDIDMARELTPDQIKGLADNPEIWVDVFPKATQYYAAINAGHPVLGEPKVWEALKYTVNYQGMVDSFLQGQFKVHQAFWPEGLWAGLEQNPYNYDLEKAKALLAEAGVTDGLEITIDTLNKSPFLDIAQSVQASLSEIGIQSNILTADGKTLWPKYRARKHDIIIARWSPDYLDPHSNADSFAHNPDNALEAKLTGKLAWRNSWADDEITAITEQARVESDLDRREQIYLDLQTKVLERSPFIIMFQQTEQVASRSNVKGLVSGASFDLVYYRNIVK